MYQIYKLLLKFEILVKVLSNFIKNLPKLLRNTTFGETRLNIYDEIKHDWRNLRTNRLCQGAFLVTSRFEICTKKRNRYFETSKVDNLLNS